MNLSNRRRVVKFRKRRGINVGVMVFLVLFVYIAINVYLFFTKEHMSIYEVQDGTTVDDNVFTGLIIREETIYETQKAGYILYFNNDGARVAKNASVYSLDDSRQILDVMTTSEEPFVTSKENNARFQHEIKKFQSSYSDANFKPVYNFKSSAQNTVMDLLNQAMIEKGQTIQDETGLAYTYEVVKSPSSGIVSYYIDQYESITSESISPELFNLDTYQQTSLRTVNMVSPNTPVYKLITSEDWEIILPIDVKHYESLTDKKRVRFTILKDGFETSAPITLFSQGANYYAKLSMNKHLSTYINDRHLEIQLQMDSVEGLKIPLSALVEKDFYLIPLEYFNKGADSEKLGVNKESFDSKTGEVSYTFVPTDIYYEDEMYGYIDTRVFPEGGRIKSPEGADSFNLFQTGKLTGVYNVNTGYAVFRRIEILTQNEAYCIINKGTSFGLSLYDHIALNSSTVTEQAIIY